MGIPVSGFPRFLDRCLEFFKFFAESRVAKFYGFFRSAAQGLVLVFFREFHQQKQWQVFSGHSVGKPSPAFAKAAVHQSGQGILKIRLALPFSDFHVMVFQYFFLVAFEFFRANKSLKPTPNFYRDLFRVIGGAAYLHVMLLTMLRTALQYIYD